MKTPEKIAKKLLNKIQVIAGEYIHYETKGKIKEDFYESVTSVQSLREITIILMSNKLISVETFNVYIKWINKYEKWLTVKKTTPVTAPTEKIDNTGIKFVIQNSDVLDRVTTDFNKLWSELKVVQINVFNHNSKEFIYYKTTPAGIEWVFYINEDENKAYYNNCFGYNLWDSWKTKYNFTFDELRIITSIFINIILGKSIVNTNNISGVNVITNKSINDALNSYLYKMDLVSQTIFSHRKD